MPTARAILEDTLSFHLNRLSPGEAADADTLLIGLRALNSVVDEINGSEWFLFREMLVASAAPLNSSTAALGVAWPTLAPGLEILGASVSTGGQDVALTLLTMEQYHGIASKSQAGQPGYLAHDGLSNLYFYPSPTNQTITLRVRAAVVEFADLDTNYLMPSGYKSALSALTAERLEKVMAGGLSADVVRAASMARSMLLAKCCRPGIINGSSGRGNILTGWN